MRKFNTIYAELKHYPAFKAEPSTVSEAISGTNILFAEMCDDLGSDDRAEGYSFLVKSYRHSASQYILNFQTDTRTFKQFLKHIYDNLQ